MSKPEPTVKVRVRTRCAGPWGNAEAGGTIDVPSAMAEAMVAVQAAEYADPEDAPKADVPPAAPAETAATEPSETAAAKPPANRKPPAKGK